MLQRNKKSYICRGAVCGRDASWFTQLSDKDMQMYVSYSSILGA